MPDVLVVEDSRFFSGLLRREIPGRLGLGVVVAETRAEARAILAKGADSFLAAVIDLHLPDSDEGEVVDDALEAGLPVLVFTTRFDDDCREDLLGRGIVDYIPKSTPDSIEQIVVMLRHLSTNPSVRILVVDDSRASRRVVVEELKKHRFAILEAKSGDEALALLKQHDDIRLVLTDYHMEGMNGCALTMEIRRHHKRSRLAIIGLSAYGNNLLSAQFMKAGANDFICKPFIAEELICRIYQNLDMVSHIAELETERRRNADRAEEMRSLSAVMDAHAIISISDAEGNITQCNDHFVALSGYARHELIGQNHRIVKSGRHDAAFYAHMWRTIAAGGTWQGVICNRAKNGTEYWVRSTIAPITRDGLPGYLSIRTDITDIIRDRERLEAQTHALETASQAADAANKAKSEFLSSMSHELRTPLNAIMGFAQLLLGSAKAPLTPKQREQVGHILSGGEHLLELINEVLDLAKIEAGKLSLSMESLDLAELIEECVRLISPLMEGHGVSMGVTVCLCDGHGRVRADRTRARQVILNLLSNAAKYNRPGGSVTVSCELLDADWIRLAVADTGRGIRPEQMAELFQPFNRLGAETTEIQGTGIGLALSRKLMESMGGRIGVHSEHGAGSRFWLDFPVAGNEPEARTAVSEPSPLPVLPDLMGEHRQLLYVEDNPANIQLMEEIIDQMDGVALITSQTAEVGLSLARTLRPAMIILDINLPGMSGIELVRRLRADPATAAIPTLALSADGTKRTIREALEAGFDAYLHKPVNVAELSTHIIKAIERDHD